MRCLEQTEIARYLAGSMEQELATQVEHHLRSCERCRLIAGQAKAAPEEPPAAAEVGEISGAVEGAASSADEATIKVRCPSCRARYLVPARRVQGRVLRIRCKSCQAIIEVQGSGKQEPSSVIDRVRKQWFLVVHRQRVGPLTEREVQDRFERGEIKSRTYVWRKGYQGWQRLAEIPEFRHLVGPRAGGRQVPEEVAATEPAQLSERGAPISADSPPAPEPAEALAAGEASGEELNAVTIERRQSIEQPDDQDDEGEVLPSDMFDRAAEEPTGPGKERMTAQRQENSVLFSLGHLKQLSQASTASAPEVKPLSSGFTGLFDIRPLATPPPPLLVEEAPDPRIGFGWGALAAVGVAGMLIGIGMIVGAVLLWAPDLVDPLLSRVRWASSPAVTTVESPREGGVSTEPSGRAGVPAIDPLQPVTSPISGEDAAAEQEDPVDGGQREAAPAASPATASEADSSPGR